MNLFRLYFWISIRTLFTFPLFSIFFYWLIFLCFVQTWFFRFFFAVFDLIFNTRKFIYIDVYWFNIKLLIRQLSSAVLYTNLGDYLEKFFVYMQTPTAARSFFGKPYRALVRYELAWYYQGNPAMFLPDKMWQDLVDIYDRSLGYKYKNFKRKARVELSNFINKPYSTLWRGLVFSFFWVLSKRKHFRGFDIRGKIIRFFTAWVQRLKVVSTTRWMYIYHGFGKDAILRGDVPALKASPYTFNFEREQVVTKERDDHLLEDPEEVRLSGLFEEILSDSSTIHYYFKPAITDNTIGFYPNRRILGKINQIRVPRNFFFKK